MAIIGTNIVVRWEHEVGDPKRRHKKKRIATFSVIKTSLLMIT